MPAGVVRELITLWGFDIDKKPLQELDAGLNTIKATLKGIGIAVATTAGIIGVLLNEAGKQEQITVAFETLIGDAELAHETLADLHDFASRTPFTIPGIEKNAKLLLGMGIELGKLKPTLKALGDVSAGLSVPLQRIALNYGQIRTQGKLTGRELRDFAVAGVPLLDELAKQFGKTKEQVTAMVSKGKVGFADVEKAFITMTSAGGKFDNLMDKQSKTLKGLLSNAEDFLIIFARELGQEILPMAKEIVHATLDWVQANRELIKADLTKFLKILVGFFGDLIDFIATFKQALDGVVGLFGGWNKALKGTFKIFTAIMGLGLVTGIGLVTKALWGLALGWKAVGVQALWANVKMMLIPAAIGAIVLAIALIAEDILAFSQGRDSVFGRMLGGLDSIFAAMKEKFGIFGEIGRFLIAGLLSPIRAVINGFKSILSVIDVLRGKKGFMEGVTDIGKNFASTLGFGTMDSLSNAAGVTEGVGSAFAQISANNNAPSSLGGRLGDLDSAKSGKAISVQAKNEINLNVEGMNPDDAKDLVSGTLQDQLGGMLRETIRDGESQIER